MTHSDLNPVNPGHPKRAAIVISNATVSTSTGWPVGFWWSELTHPYFAFTEVGRDVDVYSPDGGACKWDAMSDPEDASQWQAEDVISRGYKHDPAFLALLQDTKRINDLDVDRYHVLVVAGGQGPMFADRMTWEAGALPEGEHIMPWRVEDELRKLGANYLQAGAFRPFAIRDGNLVTRRQNFSGAEVARAILEAVGR